MQADELRDLARRAANVTGYRAILVLGSQAVHGALPDADLPSITTMSEEADLAVVNDLSGDTPHQTWRPTACHPRLCCPLTGGLTHDLSQMGPHSLGATI